MNFSFIRPMAFNIFSSRWFYLFLGGYIACIVSASSNYKRIIAEIRNNVSNKPNWAYHLSTSVSIFGASLAWPLLLPISAIEDLLNNSSTETSSPTSNETPTPDETTPISDETPTPNKATPIFDETQN